MRILCGVALLLGVLACGVSGQTLGNNGSGGGGGGGTPGGSNLDVQCNASGSFGACAFTSDSNGNLSATSIKTGGTIPDANGGEDMKGFTSGELAFTVANIAGTPTTYVYSLGATGQMLVDGGSITCPTKLPAGFPATCRQLSWVGPGTTTTVFHGNASGTGSYGAIVNADITNSTIDLTTKVTGILPPANGGCGSASGCAKRGTFASIPSCTSSITGSTYRTTDAGYVAECNGTSWYYSWGSMNGVVPTSTSISGTWFNQTSATITAEIGGALLVGTSGAGLNIQGRTHAVPSTPYTYVACAISFVEATNFENVGIMWSDGTGAVVTGIDNQNQFQHQKYTNSTTFSATYTTVTGLQRGVPLCFAEQDSGTTRKVAYSFDRQNWVVTASETHSDFLTPTLVGYYVNTASSSKIPQLLVFSEEDVVGTLF